MPGTTGTKRLQGSFDHKSSWSLADQDLNMLREQKYISVPFSMKKLEEENRPLSILRRMSELLSLSLGSSEILNFALARVMEDFHLDAGRIYLMDGDGRHLILAAHTGFAASGLEQMTLDEGFSGKAARTKSLIAQYVTELEDKKRAALLKSKGFDIIICVPLIAADRVVGIMNLATGRPFEFDSNKVDLFNVIGGQIAAAIQNERLYDDLQKKLQSLDESREMIKLFAYSTAHDLKSPAIGIHGFSKRLKEKCCEHLSADGKRYCDEIMKLAEHMIFLLEETNSYIASRETHLHFERFHLKDITGTIRAEFAARLKSCHAKLSETDSNPEIVADKTSLLRVFRNLVDNALKYGGSDMKEITIGYGWDEAFHILSVSDDGRGIETKEEEKLFEAFQRAGSSRGTMGSGLGLAIVKEIATRHGGRAWVENGNNHGAAFSISIAKGLDMEPKRTTHCQENANRPGPV